MRYSIVKVFSVYEGFAQRFFFISYDFYLLSYSLSHIVVFAGEQTYFVVRDDGQSMRILRRVGHIYHCIAQTAHRIDDQARDKYIYYQRDEQRYDSADSVD